MNEMIVGVLGGMGPESTAELLVRITRCTPAAVEQDHLRVICDSNPRIPNRTDALLSDETGPVIEALAQTALNLEQAGAGIIGIPCNTAHAFLADVRAAVGVPVLDMIGEAAIRAVEIFGEETTVGLLATDGTLRTRLYHDALEGVGGQAARPDGGCIRRPRRSSSQPCLRWCDGHHRRLHRGLACARTPSAGSAVARPPADPCRGAGA